MRASNGIKINMICTEFYLFQSSIYTEFRDSMKKFCESLKWQAMKEIKGKKMMLLINEQQ